MAPTWVSISSACSAWLTFLKSRAMVCMTVNGVLSPCARSLARSRASVSEVSCNANSSLTSPANGCTSSGKGPSSLSFAPERTCSTFLRNVSNGTKPSRTCTHDAMISPRNINISHRINADRNLAVASMTSDSFVATDKVIERCSSPSPIRIVQPVIRRGTPWLELISDRVR